jgi:RNA recognition motif-containing protein
VQADFDTTNTTLFVGGLANSVTEADLSTVFQSYGAINHVRVPPSKGCGFVQFATRESAEVALRAVHGMVVKGCTLRVSWGRNASKHGKPHVATPPLPTGGSSAHTAALQTAASWPAYVAGYQAAFGHAVPEVADAAPQLLPEAQSPTVDFGTKSPEYFDVDLSNRYTRSLRVPLMAGRLLSAPLQSSNYAQFKVA